MRLDELNETPQERQFGLWLSGVCPVIHEINAYVQRYFEEPYMTIDYTAIKSPAFGSTWFTDAYLTAEQLVAFDDWVSDTVIDVEAEIEYFLGIGIIVRLTVDSRNETVLATLTNALIASPTYGGILTARSANPIEALYLALFKARHTHPVESWVKESRTGKRG